MNTGDVHRNQYDHIKCPVCGHTWLPWTDPVTGRTTPGHPEEYPCHRHRPPPDPGPVVRARRRQEAYDRRHGTHPPAVPAAGTESSLPASVDQAEIARRELEGAVPTREWVVPLRGEPPNLFVGKVAFPDGTFQPVGRGLYEAIQEAQINVARNGEREPLPPARNETDDLYDQ